jgi:hypothetical protein
MKKLLLLLGVVLAVAGCAASPQVPLGGAAESGPNIVATLARTGTCEMDVAADFTALVSYQKKAARAVAKGAITVDEARQILVLAEITRIDLDRACPDVTAKLDVLHRDSARESLKAIANILEKKP